MSSRGKERQQVVARRAIWVTEESCFGFVGVEGLDMVQGCCEGEGELRRKV